MDECTIFGANCLPAKGIHPHACAGHGHSSPVRHSHTPATTTTSTTYPTLNLAQTNLRSSEDVCNFLRLLGSRCICECT